MSKQLIIAEKPSVANDIARALGGFTRHGEYFESDDYVLSSAVGLAGNQNFMDPSAVAGFSPFSGAADYVTNLGGGPDVYSAAAQAVRGGMSDSPADALLHAALNSPAGAVRSAPGPSVNTQAGGLPPGVAGTVQPGDPRYLGSQPAGDSPADMLLRAALGGQHAPEPHERSIFFNPGR